MDDYTRRRRSHVDHEYRKRRLLILAAGGSTSLLPAARAQAHLQRLYDLGWSLRALAQYTGMQVTDTSLANLKAGLHEQLKRNTVAAVMSIPYTAAVNEHVAPEAWVPVLGAQRRARALLALGWNHDELKKRMPLYTNHISRATYNHMHARNWRDLDNLYRELCMTPGPSRITAQRADRAGYAPPLVWDDIDNPDEQPMRGNRGQWLAPEEAEELRIYRATKHAPVDPNVVDRVLSGEWSLFANPAERVEICRRFVEAGGSTHELEALSGWRVSRYYRKGDAA